MYINVTAAKRYMSAESFFSSQWLCCLQWRFPLQLALPMLIQPCTLAVFLAKTLNVFKRSQVFFNLITLVSNLLPIWGEVQEGITPKFKLQFHHCGRTRSLITPKEPSNVAGHMCLWGQRKEGQRNWVFIAMLPVRHLFALAFSDECGGSLSSGSWCCAKRYHPFIII